MFKYVMILSFLLLPAYVHAAPTASDCDFNNSGKVDFGDFIAFSQGYGTTQTQFDLNGDGAVNFQDFVIFAQFYGQTITTPPPTTDAPVGIEVGMQAPDFTLRTPHWRIVQPLRTTRQTRVSQLLGEPGVVPVLLKCPTYKSCKIPWVTLSRLSALAYETRGSRSCVLSRNTATRGLLFSTRREKRAMCMRSRPIPPRCSWMPKV